MAETIINGPIKPISDQDGNELTYPTHISKYGKGGLVQLDTQKELDNFPGERLEEGMIFYVKNTRKFYKVDSISESVDDFGIATYTPTFSNNVFDPNAAVVTLEDGVTKTVAEIIKDYNNSLNWINVD